MSEPVLEGSNSGGDLRSSKEKVATFLRSTSHSRGHTKTHRTFEAYASAMICIYWCS